MEGGVSVIELVIFSIWSKMLISSPWKLFHGCCFSFNRDDRHRGASAALLYSVVRKMTPSHFCKTKYKSVLFFLIRDLASFLEQSLIIIGLYSILYECLLYSNVC